MDPARRPPRPWPRERTHPLSALVFGWTWGVFRDGYRRDFTAEDLYDPLQEDTSCLLGDKLEKHWMRQQERRSQRQVSLRRSIFAVFAADYVKLGLLVFLHGLILSVVQPLLLGELLGYFEEPTEEAKFYAYLHAGGIAVSSGLNTVLYSQYTLGTWRLGTRVRTACCSLLYRKSLRLSQTALGETPVGQIVNLLSNDVSRFEKVSIFLHYLWLSPLLAVLATLFMYLEVGWPALVGMAAVVAVLPLQGYMSHLSARYRSSTAYLTDSRIRLIDDIVSGISAIKMYTWEIPFTQLVNAVRKREIDVLTPASYIRGIYMTLTLCSTRTAFFCTMTAMALFQDTLTARKVFVLQSYFNVLSNAVSMNLVRGMSEVAEVCVSVRRLQNFMLLSELTEEDKNRRRSVLFNASSEELCQKLESTAFVASMLKNDDEYTIIIQGLTAKWNPLYVNPTLSEINLCVKKGILAAVVGPVGSGKSSLLQAILGELPAREGAVVLNGEVSYSSQEAWVFAATVRQNILFGLPYERVRYEEVLRVCVLDRDLEQLPRGDLTMVGDQGTSLSGGQKTRINLARAIYKKADIYLFDDPLASLDSYVAKELFEQCIEKFLANKTRILVTNHLQYVQRPDLVVMMDNGCAVVIRGDLRDLSNLGNRLSRISSLSSDSSEEEMFEKHSSAKSLEEEKEWTSFDMMEESSKGKIQGKSVYKEYLCSASNTYINIIVFFLFVKTEVLVSGIDYFVSFWTTQEELRKIQELDSQSNETVLKVEAFEYATSFNATTEPYEILSLELCIAIYGILVAMLFFCTLLRSLAFYKVCMKCSKKLHDNVFQSVIQAKLHFFSNNPTGRILNRFSKDMGAVDEILPRTMLNAVQIIMQMAGYIVVSVMVNYFFAIPVVVIGTIFWFVRRIYLKTSNNLKRIEGIAKSPVFTHFHATMKGLPTVRAYGAQAVLSQEFDEHQDRHTSAWYMFAVTSTAFGFFLDIFVSIFIAIVTVGSLAIEGKFMGVFGGHAGLAITQSMSLSGMLQWGVRQTAEVANNMMSVERLVEYSCLQAEPSLEDAAVEEDWPKYGRIEFVNVYVRYNEMDPPAIRNLNITINPQQKVGIVGRTGAGKSSLVAALFRLSWAVEGRVLVDGVDAGTVPLRELRRRIAIIPQEPLMFAGSMRQNLDPTQEFSDAQLLHVLEEVELRSVLHAVEGLDTRVVEGGRNLSAGQRQLVCLARAILRANKILVMDEATANVDQNTDTLIQKTIRMKFKKCTILTVAHRLETVMDYDRILVVEAGQVVEFDHPHLLLRNTEGYLYKMVNENSKTVINCLFKKAQQSYERPRRR